MFMGLRSDWLQELDSVPERIEHVHSIEPFERLIRCRRIACGLAPLSKTTEIVYQERGMRFPGRVEVRVDAEMEAQKPGAEPHSATPYQIGRLRLFDETEDARIEGPRLGLLPSRHGQLYVIESDDFSHGKWVRQSAGITLQMSRVRRHA